MTKRAKQHRANETGAQIERQMTRDALARSEYLSGLKNRATDLGMAVASILERLQIIEARLDRNL